MSDESASPVEPEFPIDGRLLGVDFGTKRVGLAVSDIEQRIAAPLETWERHGKAVDAAYISSLTEEHRIAGFIVGLPVHMSGDESGKSREARKFGDWLQRVTGLPVRHHDERYSTVKADAVMLEAGLSRGKRKARVDRMAAQFILQDYLDGDRTGAEPPDLSV